jgi:carbamoyl-phosphate synthase large subunit
MRNPQLRTVLLLGSGALKIGEAGEFDYSGSQAVKALKEEGVRVILVNPNIATNQTSENLADRVYFLPVDAHFVARIIERERPDGILLSFGGQTALNCGLQLKREGVLDKYGVRVLGTPVSTIEDTEDRELFVKRLKEIDIATPRSEAVTTVGDALRVAEEIGYPVILRAGFALGGEGSGVARNPEALKDLSERALVRTPQVLIEEYLGKWKEIEYEIVRDCADNCIAVCNMENFDPMGIHTGESIVVAPSQTLTNHEYQMLRSLAIRTIRHLGVIGECNIQYALHPHSREYRVIEVNARLSRSSALASKATGYPLAYIAAKLALGYTLPELPNTVTGQTSACFEPALDYLVVKYPRWDLDKFKRVDTTLGSAMKSVGEVMAIGRCFEEALQKAVRMLGLGEGLLPKRMRLHSEDDLGDTQRAHDLAALATPTPQRLLDIAIALHDGTRAEDIAAVTGIDLWFIAGIARIVSFQLEMESEIAATGQLSDETVGEAKRLGFSDARLARLLGHDDIACGEREVRQRRVAAGILPSVKQIDTLAAEYPAATNYLYCSYGGDYSDITAAAPSAPAAGLPQATPVIARLDSPSGQGAERSKEGDEGALPPPGGRGARRSVVILGSGSYRIGSSVEFDWCTVVAARTLRERGYTTIMINHNPETVSTDYDICDKLYFEELSVERVLDICDVEQPEAVVLSMGGQTPNNLARRLYEAGVPVLGTSPLSIDRAEDRHKFSALLDELGVDQPPWQELSRVEDVERFAASVGYPVLVRPSYVLSGSAMNVAYEPEHLHDYLRQARVGSDHPIVVSKFVEHAKELEIDAVAARGKLVIYALTEHVENAGVHSGDATVMLLRSGSTWRRCGASRPSPNASPPRWRSPGPSISSSWRGTTACR